MGTRGMLMIGHVILDQDRRCLRDSAGVDIALRPKSLDVLRALASRPGQTLTKAELLDSVWPNVCVTEDSLFQCVRDIRRAIGDGEGRILRSLPRQGYLLDVPVTAVPNELLSEPERAQWLDRPSIAVLPFKEKGAAGTEQYFAEGISSDLLTGLCRIRWLHVTARSSSFLFKDDHADLREVERQLGVRYVLKGSIQVVDERVRIHCHLRDAAKERYVWGECFEGNRVDIFELQDRITERIVGTLEPTIRGAEIERARAKPTENLDAYDLYLRALPLHLSSEPGKMGEAQKLLAEAIALDPNYSLAKAFSAFTTVIQANQGWATDIERKAAIALARQALADHRNDPVILRCVGHALAYLAHEHEAGLALLELALALHPNSADIHQSAGWVWNFSCNGAEALPHFQRAMKLSPIDPETGHTLSGITFAHLLAGRHEDALEASRKAVAAMPNSMSPLRAAIFALCELGRRAESIEMGRALIRVNPSFRLGAFERMQPFKDPVFAGRYLRALRVAGLPE
jgi:TolB-like protein/Tfp pilus assembly protein PilF